MAAILMLLAFGTGAFAFVSYVDGNGNVLRWNLTTLNLDVHTNVVNRATKAIRYFIGTDTFSSANRTAEMNAIRASFAQWQSIPGANIRFEEGGVAGSSIDINTADNTNAIFWAKKSTLVNGGTISISGLPGFTLVAFDANNSLLEGDIVLNGIQYSWFTDFNDSVNAARFVEAVAAHEIGHLLGLDHTVLGGATVINANYGVGTETGLAADELAAARALYPIPAFLSTLGGLRGRVLISGSPVFGAMVIAENAAGNAVSGTVSRVNGVYELPALPPGAYHIRACPLDPSNTSESASLLRGKDIAVDYDTVTTAFLATTNKPVTLAAGQTNALDLTVAAGSPAFRITSISHPTPFASAATLNRFAGFVRPGQSNLYVGVSSTTLPTTGATLSLTGDGIAGGPTVVEPNRFGAGWHLLYTKISVATNATPGLRSLVVQKGTNVAYANGYIEVMPLTPDDNFDGLSDLFQRKYFPIFTAPQAAPDFDYDQDGFSNRYEFRTGSDPTNALSARFKIESTKTTANGTTITWQSDAGKRYQVMSHPDLGRGLWQKVGAPISATGPTAQFLDASATTGWRFYRVDIVP